MTSSATTRERHLTGGPNRLGRTNVPVGAPHHPFVARSRDGARATSAVFLRQRGSPDAAHGGRRMTDGPSLRMALCGHPDGCTRPRRVAATTAIEEQVMADEGGQVTGTADKDYNIIWFVEQCLSNALRLETYVQDAERQGDQELADFFRRAQGESRKGGEQGKELLRARLAE
jgi:hypothetical protein